MKHLLAAAFALAALWPSDARAIDWLISCREEPISCQMFIVGFVTGQRWAHQSTAMSLGIEDFSGVKWVNISRAAGSPFCVPDEVGGDQMLDVFMAYLEANPKDRHTAISGLVYEALTDAWPCAPMVD